jgi:transcriptional regulator with XRE-family HTH domain
MFPKVKKLIRIAEGLDRIKSRYGITRKQIAEAEDFTPALITNVLSGRTTSDPCLKALDKWIRRYV